MSLTPDQLAQLPEVQRGQLIELQRQLRSGGAPATDAPPASMSADPVKTESL